MRPFFLTDEPLDLVVGDRPTNLAVWLGPQRSVALGRLALCSALAQNPGSGWV
jgi:hypothetical protein